jgi:uncharacterized repeat protein (TIGR01451 family)
MTDRGADSELFEQVILDLLKQGLSVRFRATGASMTPAIRDGDIVEVTPVIVSKLRKDDIVLGKTNEGFRLHRIVSADPDNDVFITRGDRGQENDPALKGAQILGRAEAKEVRIGQRVVRAKVNSLSGQILSGVARGQRVARKALDRLMRFTRRKQNGSNICALLFALVLFSLAPTYSSSQVAVDASTSTNSEITGTGTKTITFNHKTTGTNLLLIVGVSMTITNQTASAVTGVTYNSVTLTSIGAHNDAGNTRRVEMWYLLNPPTGTHSTVVSINIPSNKTIGVAVGATTFTGVDQTVPLGTFVSADGAGGTTSQLDVPSVVNGMILDTLAVGGNRTVAAAGPQVSQWNQTSGTIFGSNDPPDVTGTGSSRTGAPSVPISESFSNTSNWSLGAIPINPTTADLGVTTSVSAVALGQNSTYNITVTNSGLSAANSAVLTDTLASGLTLISTTPSAGTSCSGTGPITCTLPASLASGASATVAVVVKAATAGFYPNTASVTDSGTPPDPNTGNNTYVALAPVVSIVCSTGTLVAGGTLTGVQNTYFPGTASVAAGAISVPIGASTGAGGTIVAGSELLVIQMQDASVNTTNSVVYGNGSTGTGFTSINNAGNYEYVTATGPVSGGSVPIAGAGPAGGLVFGYTAAAASATKGRSTYQVVLVPQYASATLGAATAAAWNGSTGGILALDIAGQLNLGSATVAVDGLGFRGGAGMQLTGGYGGTNTDYVYLSPTAYTGAVGGATGVDASKGEGVAGTPMWAESGGTFLQTTTTVGYPSGTAGTDGSMARGAPANAGAGGTDSDSAGNTQNAGGGGGANGGSGGFGGDSWNTNLSSGGEGGSVFPATIDRIALGGAGGAGSRNNSDGDNQASGGAAGGGIIFIRANSLTGTATLTANGAAAYNGTANDAGGGGGAGGAIVVISSNGGESGLTLQASGGRGGDAWDSQAYSLADRHGPGGGGGGGVVFVSGTPAGISVSGGSSGTTLNPGVTYGATAGTAGISSASVTMSQVTGIQSSSLCAADLTLSKTHAGNFTRGSSAVWTIPVSNVSLYGATSGVVTMNDTLPIGVTPISATGTGWSCSVSGQTLSCVRSDLLSAAGTYPSITVNVNVLQSAPATVTNTAFISGGNEANLLNDMATDVATVVSSADMAVTDSASPNPVAAGANITYTQVVTDNGPSAGDNATFATAVPTNTTLVSIAAPSGWTCSSPGAGNTGSIVCTDTNMPGSTSGTFTMIVKVNPGVANGTVITNSVSVASSATDPNSANNSATATTVVGGTGPNLSVTNAASPNPVQAGSNITYTQVVTNTGTTAVTGGTFTETTPANTTFVSITPPAGWTCTGFPLTPCTDASVAAGASGTFSVVYKVNAGTASGTVITDTVTTNATNQSYGANSAVATDVVATAAQADLALSTSANPVTVLAGNQITYTQTVTNNGPAAAAGAIFTQATPTNTTFQSISAPAGWTCTTPASGATGTITCANPSVAAGIAADILVVLNVPSTVTASSITAASSVSATTSDPLSSNNSTSVTTNVNVACDLTVTNSGTPSPVSAGSNITYTQTITNQGPANCSTGTFTEATPANTTFVSVGVVTTGSGTWTCPNSAPISCSNPSVVPGSTATITAVYKVTAGTAAGTVISDTDTGGTATRDTNPADNSATLNIAVASGTQADLSVTNSGSPSPATAGSNITYTQTVTNAGPATANAPVMTETQPANTTAVSLTGPAGWTCVLASLTCTDTTTMASATSANFTFVVKVNSNVVTGTTITQMESVSSSTSDPNSGNNSSTVSIPVGDTVDLSVTNTASPVPVQAGNNITYAQVVNNAGPSTATSVTLTDTLPANTTAVSLTGPAGWTCTLATLTCTDPSLVSGAPATIAYVVQVNAGTAAGTAINETASVSSAVGDSNPTNNTAVASDVVATATQADLVVSNSASPTSLSAGSDVTYTQTVTNNGPAVATGATFTEAIPANMNFQSITIPTGWTCSTLPAVGGTGTISCSDGSSLGTGAGNAANFSVVLQANSGTPSGTNITDTASASATNVIPGLTSNTASATVLIASASSADMAITKTGTPNPVTQQTTLTYMLAVKNNGPATTTNVTVQDVLPSTVLYSGSTSTQGTCSEAGGTVSCLLGTMANGATATIFIVVFPQQAGSITNTATVTADQSDPNPANNTASQTELVVASTKVTLRSFSAHIGTDKNGAKRTVLVWKTSGEAHNLGFNVYREQNGNRVRMNSAPIAGSALMMSGFLPKHAGRTYSWIDPSAGAPGASYWLEDIDVNGARTMHGPVSAMGAQPANDSPVAEARMLNQLNQALPVAAGSQVSNIREYLPITSAPRSWQIAKQFELAEHSAIKINVRHEGWYRINQPDLVKAGLDPNVDPSSLHLYAEAVQQPIQITGATVGRGGFGPQASISFYGTGIDTVFSGTRVYWLAEERGPALRIPQMPVTSGSGQPPVNFSATARLQQRSIYFAALITQDGQNFFGALVSTTPVDQVLTLSHFDSTSDRIAHLDLSLQGVVVGFPHDVTVSVNGTTIGDVIFNGQDKGTMSIDVPAGVLQPWNNTVTLTSQNGDYDLSLVDYIQITYPHQYMADSDMLKFTGRPGDQLAVSGFTSAPTVIDITDASHPVELSPQVTSSNGNYDIAVQVPFTRVRSMGGQHILLAVANDRIASVAGTYSNHPSHWHLAQRGADIAMVTHGEFAAALAPLVQAHEAEGKTSVIVPIGELYDEFSFGERNPSAIKQFLQTAQQNWRKPPSYLLLNGRASLDPRNYLGFGNLDLVPTSYVPTSSLMTSTDDWFSDFTNTGLPTIATGRLPVSTVDEAATVVGKIVAYENQSTNGPWTSNALMVADRNDTINFTQDSQTVQANLPLNMQVSNVFVDTVGTTAAQEDILNGINSGQSIVNYLGHGSEEEWSGSDIFDENGVNSLTNGSQLPLFLIMNCLNGYFQDVYAQPLAVTLLLAPNGGAAAVLASSGLNQAPPQAILDALVVHNAERLTLGVSVMNAKSGVTDPDVRRTYILFGDPAMKLKPPAGTIGPQ